MPNIDISKYQRKKQAEQSVSEDGGLLAFLNKDISFGKKGLPDKKKEQFYLELSSLLQAGVNLKSGLELLNADQDKKQEKQLFQSIQQAVIAGAGFAEALEKSGKFSVYETVSIRIGEETGKLNEVLQDMATFYQNKIKQRRKIISALTYPCIVLSSSLGAVFFMLKFIVPMFGDVFKRFGGKLPWITEKIIGVSQAMEHYFPVFLLFIGALIFCVIAFRHKELFRKVSTGILLRIPVIGNLVRKIYLARFCNSMRLLINARIPLLNALGLIRQMISFYPLESSLPEVEHAITRGKSLHQSLQQFDIYPPKMIQLIKVGEETNQLDLFFGKIADQYVEEVEYQTTTLSSVMEPLIIIFLGLVVGLILISMYLPLFEMSNSFQ